MKKLLLFLCATWFACCNSLPAPAQTYCKAATWQPPSFDTQNCVVNLHWNDTGGEWNQIFVDGSPITLSDGSLFDPALTSWPVSVTSNSTHEFFIKTFCNKDTTNSPRYSSAILKATMPVCAVKKKHGR